MSESPELILNSQDFDVQELLASLEPEDLSINEHTFMDIEDQQKRPPPNPEEITHETYRETRRLYTEYYSYRINQCFYSGFLSILKCKCGSIVDSFPCYQKRIYHIKQCTYCKGGTAMGKLSIPEHIKSAEEKWQYHHVNIVE